KITLASTLTAGAGYFALARRVDVGLLTSCLGVLFLAMGSAALNQWQERTLDARMERTRRRPIPSGAMSPADALAVVAVLAGAGVFLLLRSSALAAALGLAAMAWYNGVYTFLKRVTAFAAVPGALIGALPPAIGWTAAGGSPLDRPVLALCFF